MAFSSSILTAEPRSWSIGPWKVELHSIGAASGDTSGTVTASSLGSVIAAIPAGLAVADVSVSGATATLTFADPAATVAGTILLIGR